MLVVKMTKKTLMAFFSFHSIQVQIRLIIYKLAQFFERRKCRLQYVFFFTLESLYLSVVHLNFFFFKSEATDLQL